MRLRVLVTNGVRTVDLIWLEHNGTDVYYGFRGHAGKDSYHETGKRHSVDGSGERRIMDQHHPLAAFRGQLQLCGFGFDTSIAGSDEVSEYRGKPGDAVVWIDARTLSGQVNVSLGLLEVGAFQELLPVHTVVDSRMLQIVTSTVPWIYIQVFSVESLRAPA